MQNINVLSYSIKKYGFHFVLIGGKVSAISTEIKIKPYFSKSQLILTF